MSGGPSAAPGAPRCLVEQSPSPLAHLVGNARTQLAGVYQRHARALLPDSGLRELGRDTISDAFLNLPDEQRAELVQPLLACDLPPHRPGHDRAPYGLVRLEILIIPGPDEPTLPDGRRPKLVKRSHLADRHAPMVGVTLEHAHPQHDAPRA